MHLIEEKDKRPEDELAVSCWDDGTQYTISGVGTMKDLVEILKNTKHKNISVALVPGRQLIEEIRNDKEIGCQHVYIKTTDGIVRDRLTIWYEDSNRFDNLQFFK